MTPVMTSITNSAASFRPNYIEIPDQRPAETADVTLHPERLWDGTIATRVVPGSIVYSTREDALAIADEILSGGDVPYAVAPREVAERYARELQSEATKPL